MSKPAFPRPFSGKEVTSPSQNGMSLLEYYAGEVFGKMYKQFAEVIVRSNTDKASEDKESIPWKSVAKYCFDGAEAMVKEAEKRSQ